MIKKFEEFRNYRPHYPSYQGKKLANGNYKSLDELKSTLGHGCDEETALLRVDKEDYNFNKISNDYGDDFCGVYYLGNVFTGQDYDDDVYVIYGNDHDGYNFDRFTIDEIQ